MQKLTYKLLALIASSLGLPKDRLHGFFKNQTSFMRLNYYPPCPAPQLALGLGRHKDAGAMTILAQDDVGGLEVKRKSDGEWIFVKPTPDAYIVNVGDLIQVQFLDLNFLTRFHLIQVSVQFSYILKMIERVFLQVWSNDKYESVEHRVTVNSQKERFSIPFFINPSHSVWVEPLAELVDEQTPAKYKGYSWGSFMPPENLAISRSLPLKTFKYITSSFRRLV
ncbi:UNVERIFIED_CONTAM: putative 2-oxoglutarate-dependent dioxygenase [Sesamum radiatum]|uniref:2-oxoglutarate-dependent dioxygenase n=1 Tax=Sesamum radiatum TaxID=300843 RepID=A0AAW2RVH0_SESRA